MAMISVCFTHDPDENFQMQWDYVLTNFKPDNIYIVCNEKLDLNRKSPRSKATIIKNINELPANIPLIVFNPKLGRHIQGEISLLEFTHPKDAIYLFGSDMGHLTKEYFSSRKPDHLVYIPVDTDDEMFSFMAAAIAMWDRRIKNG